MRGLVAMRIIDADGQINDYAYVEEIAKSMPKGNQSSTVFPVLDHFHWQYLRQKRGGRNSPGPKE